MRWNPVTKKVEGVLRSLTKAEHDETERLAQDGKLLLKRHPSKSEIMELDARYAAMGEDAVRAEIEAAEKARAEHENG